MTMSKDPKITVLVVEPEKKPHVKEIDNTLESLQHEVDGYIQAIYPWTDDVCAAIICDDEAKLKSKPLNRALRDENGVVYDIIAGTFLVLGLTEEDFGSLSSELIQQFSEHFKTPEIFINCDGGLIILQSET